MRHDGDNRLFERAIGHNSSDAGVRGTTVAILVLCFSAYQVVLGFWTLAAIPNIAYSLCHLCSIQHPRLLGQCDDSSLTQYILRFTLHSLIGHRPASE